MSKRLKELFDNARTTTFKFEGASITIREGLGVDSMDGAVYRRYLKDGWRKENEDPKANVPLEIPDIDWNRMVNFVGFIMRTVKIKGTVPNGFTLPDKDDAEELYKSFWEFLVLPAELIEKWDTELVKVNRPTQRPEANPGDDTNTKSS